MDPLLWHTWITSFGTPPHPNKQNKSRFGKKHCYKVFRVVVDHGFLARYSARAKKEHKRRDREYAFYRKLRQPELNFGHALIKVAWDRCEFDRGHPKHKEALRLARKNIRLADVAHKQMLFRECGAEYRRLTSAMFRRFLAWQNAFIRTKLELKSSGAPRAC